MQLDAIREKVAKMSGGDGKEVRFVVSPFRICPLGAHIDHQVSLEFLFYRLDSLGYGHRLQLQ